MKLIETIFGERFLYKLSKLGISILNGLVITHEHDVAITDDAIKQAMYYLYKRHPLLQCYIHITKIRRKTYFAVPETDAERKAVKDMKFERVKIQSKDDIVPLLEKFNEELFDYDKKCLMFKLMVFEWKHKDKDMFAFSLSVPHVFTDGINTVTLCVEFLNILNSVLQNTKCNEMVEELKVVEDSGELIKKSKLIMNEVRQRFKNRKKNYKTIKFKLPAKLANRIGVGSKINLLVFDEDVTGKLVSYAKTNKIRFTGMLSVAMFNAFKELYKENEIEFPKDVCVYIPISVRHRVQPIVDNSETRICVAMDVLNIKRFGEHDNFAEESRNADSLLSADINDGLIYESLINPFFKMMTAFMDLLSSRNIINFFTAIAPSDLIVSNIGTYVADSKQVLNGQLRVNEVYFGDLMNENSGFGLYTQTFNKKLTIRLSTNRKTFDSKHSDRFMALFEQQLNNLVN